MYFGDATFILLIPAIILALYAQVVAPRLAEGDHSEEVALQAKQEAPKPDPDRQERQPKGCPSDGPYRIGQRVCQKSRGHDRPHQRRQTA